MEADQPTVAIVPRNQVARQVARWSVYWLKLGTWVCGLLLWLFHRQFPEVTTPVGYLVGALTGLAAFYLMHYLVLTACGRTVRRVCLPIVVLMEILALGGIIALCFRPSSE